VTDVRGSQPAGASGLAGPPRERPLIVELLESLPDPVIGCDTKGRVVYWSAGAREAYGYSTTDALGVVVTQLLMTRFPQPLLEIMEEVTDLGRWQGRLVHHTKDGRDVAVESRWVARYDDAGTLVGGIAIEREVPADPFEQPSSPPPERGATAAQQLRQTEWLESLGQLAGGMAHDFNNALAIVINYASLVSTEVQRLRTAPSDSQRAALCEDLQEIQTAAEHAADLTHQLLALSRQEVGAPQRLDLNASIREIKQLLTLTVGERIRVEIDLAEDLALVSADPSQAQQIVVSLAVNARDAMPSGGTLTIDTANVVLGGDAALAHGNLAPGSYVRLRVSDTGPSVTPATRTGALDPLLAAEDGGTGSGLARVHGIVVGAGGHAVFQSEPGVGTTFVALLPACEAL
jgi:PAS domain S-box-containing protein